MKRLPCLCALLLSCSNVLAAPDYRQQAFRLPAMTESLVVADMNGDGLMDLLSVVEQSIRIYFQSAPGFDFEQQFQEVSFDANAVGWDLSKRFSSTNSTALIALLDGRELLAWEFDGTNPPQSRQIESNLPGFLSRGINRLHFARDINGDEADDLIIPGAGQLHLLINNGDNSFQPPLSIQSEMRLRSALNNNRFNRSAGQAISIPQLELRDVNADGHDDLVSRTEERLGVFLADPVGSAWFPPRASYSLDIAAIEAELGEFDIDNLDFSNLTGVLALTHEEILEDVDGDGIEDLLLREGGKVSLFGGHSEGMNFEQPRQVLRSGGNVLTTFLYDENEDGLKDLWLWRVEPVSVGDVFVWLALSGSIAIEAFIYPNDGERFARRPARRITVDLRFPSVMRLANAYEELNRSTDALAPGEIPPNRLAEVDDDNSAGDLLVLLQQRLDIFLNSIEPEQEQQDFLGPLGYSRQRDNYEIDIRQIIEDVDIRNNPRLTAVAERSAELSIPLNETVRNGDVIPARLNQDEVDDIFVFTGFDASHIRGLLLLSN